ncbi:MAG: DPP IV N-terminal domain-containing protein [Longimicrobiales bacterium]
MRFAISVLTLTAFATLAGTTATAQQTRAYAPAALTAEDYADAERFLRAYTAPLVFGASVDAVWLPDGRFWYRNDTPDGTEFVIVDADARTRDRFFDVPRLAVALSAAADTTYTVDDLPIRSIELTDDDRSVSFQVGSGRFRCDLDAYRCAPEPLVRASPDRDVVVSPDGRLGAFRREYDLWVRDLATGEETRLTTDGIEHFGYATNNAGWTRSDRPVVLWSPDSRSIATFQHDARGVGDMYLVSTEVGHPRLEAWKYPMPGDSLIFRIERVVIHLNGAGAGAGAPRLVRLDMPPDAHRSTICDHVVCGGEWTDIAWSADGSRLFFVSSSRAHDRATLREANPVTGQVRDILVETEETFFNLSYRAPNWRVLPESDELIWYSQRDDWGHLYLYDLSTGGLKRQITEGDWNVLELLRVDRDARTVTFIGNEREPGDPYFEHLYRVSLDGGPPTLLTPDSANHRIALSPSGEFFVDSYSTPTTPPVTVLRDARDGRVVMELERADITRLLASGWQPPIPFSVKARDGVTDLYGLMYRPTDFDPSLRYPIINHIYPGPQGGSVGSRSFVPSRGDAQAIAELGFIVVELDALGSGPKRSKSFQEAYYGDMGDNGLPDQVGGMRQLAERHPWIDLERAGIYGHSGGGYASTGAILRYPDFFDVAVSQAGNHDNRNYEDDWGEQWQGLLEVYPDGSTNYDDQANAHLAGNLEGKLLLAHGTTDSNVPPSNTLLVVDALIDADKDFDLILFPNRGHGFGNEPYMIRRRWDYFVRHLMGAEPPKDYKIGERPVM